MNKSAGNIVIGLILGVALTLLLTNFSNAAKKPHITMMENDNPSNLMMGAHGSNMTMADMTTALTDLEGDEFDKAFIEMMIDHHQGAIDMAKLSETRANHQEVKDLSKDIIEAQTKEINNMQDWLKMWNY